MHITNLFLKTVLSSALTLASLSIFAADSREHTGHAQHQHHTGQHATQSTSHQGYNTEIAVASFDEQQQSALTQPVLSDEPVNSASSHDHRKEHGAQIYSRVILDQKWQHHSKGNGAFKSENEVRIGTDENKLFLKLQADKYESSQTEYDAKVLYSRNIADFWDVQTGLRYRQENLADPATQQQNERFDVVFGLHGLAPYFFETDAFLYVGENNFVGLTLETERDLLLTQKLIMQPFIELDLILKDQARNAKKTGLRHATLGLKTRYEVSKKFMPYLEVAYEYNKGNQKTAWQQGADSEQSWIYAAGFKMMF
ncbi:MULTISPECIES: copper resistance protein B [unclassified Acinetobacter]|uniref:copper resistance protein B n=1 Tax=unclassified Acinetobacter TaxID=196816 RepID=UPI001C21FA66|nr:MULTISPECIES: copper resistance protein B [unclassified Acinetobacter]